MKPGKPKPPDATQPLFTLEDTLVAVARSKSAGQSGKPPASPPQPGQTGTDTRGDKLDSTQPLFTLEDTQMQKARTQAPQQEPAGGAPAAKPRPEFNPYEKAAPVAKTQVDRMAEMRRLSAQILQQRQAADSDPPAKPPAPGKPKDKR